MKAVEVDIGKYPDSYQYKRAKKFGVSKTGIWHALQRLNITYKKNTSPSKNRSKVKSKISRKD